MTCLSAKTFFSQGTQKLYTIALSARKRDGLCGKTRICHILSCFCINFKK